MLFSPDGYPSLGLEHVVQVRIPCAVVRLAVPLQSTPPHTHTCPEIISGRKPEHARNDTHMSWTGAPCVGMQRGGCGWVSYCRQSGSCAP